MFTTDDEKWMQHAINLAKQAADVDEVPVGSVLVLNNAIIGEGYNRSITNRDPTAHAEIIALRDGANRIGNYRLVGSTLYVTLEPCAMCASAMVHARIQTLIFGSTDPRTGAVVSQIQLLDQSYLNHRIRYQGGLYHEQCGQMLSQFFQGKRLK